MTREEIGSVLKQLRIAAGKTQKEVAEIIGRKQQIIGHWETGYSQPDANTLFTLCDIYGTTVDDAFGFNKNPVSQVDLELLKKYHALDHYGQEHVQTILDWETVRVSTLQEKEKYIAGLETTPDFIIECQKSSKNSNSTTRLLQYFQSVSAGTGQLLYDNVYSKGITIPDIPKYRRVAYAVKVSGNSMEPLYYNDDILLIEPTCEVTVGEIGIFSVDSQAYVKKLGNGELISLNPKYGNITLNDEARCMGRVVDKFIRE